MKKTSATLTLLALFAGITGQAFALVNPAIVDLGAAGAFTILVNSAITTTPGSGLPTAIMGDMGTASADTSLAGWGQVPLNANASTVFSVSPLDTGQIYAFNYIAPTPGQLTTATNDMVTAYNDAAGRNPGDIVLELGAGTIGTPQGALPRGVYKWATTLDITTDLTLSGSATDVWVFIVGTVLDVATGKKILLSGGALPSNIFWAVGSATLHAGVDFNGNILSSTLIAMQDSAALHGKALAQTSVTLIGNAIDSAPVTMANSPTPTPTGSPTGTRTASPTVTSNTTSTRSPTATATGTATPTGTPGGAGPATVTMGCADGFSALAATTLSNTGNSSATGYVGLYPGTSMTGMGTMTESCTNHTTDALAQCAQTALTAAYTDASTRPLPTTIPVELGGHTYQTGVYHQTSLGLSFGAGPLVLDGNGDPNAVFIFQSDSTLITGPGGQVQLIGGAQAKNVFWAIYAGVTFDTTTHFVGTVMSDVGAITMLNGSSIEGRVMSMTGAISLDTVAIDTVSSAITPCTSNGTATATRTPATTFSSTPTRTPSATASASPTVTATATPSGTPVIAASSTSTTTPVATAATTPNDTYIYPSPARGDKAAVTYLMAENGDVTVRIYNQTGRPVDTITEAKNAGWQWSGVSVGKFASGTYYYVVSMQYASGAKEIQKARKFVVIH